MLYLRKHKEKRIVEEKNDVQKSQTFLCNICLKINMDFLNDGTRYDVRSIMGLENNQLETIQSQILIVCSDIG